MDLAFWYIILLAINISGEQTDFNLSIKDGEKNNQIHIYRIMDNIWTLDFPDKGDISKTIPVNVKIEDNISLKTLLFDSPLLLDKLCDCKELDWDNVKTIKLREALQKKGETDIMIKRNTKGFALSQKNGFLSRYKEITINWGNSK